MGILLCDGRTVGMITILSALLSMLSFRCRSRASRELELVALRSSCYGNALATSGFIPPTGCSQRFSNPSPEGGLWRITSGILVGCLEDVHSKEQTGSGILIAVTSSNGVKRIYRVFRSPQYAQRFAENDITFSILPDLTDEALALVVERRVNVVVYAEKALRRTQAGAALHGLLHPSRRGLAAPSGVPSRGCLL